MTLQELYALFKNDHPEVKIGRTKFGQLRPINVLLSSSLPHNTCQCKYHENFILLLEALHKVSSKIPIYSSDFVGQMVCQTSTHHCWSNQCHECNDAAFFRTIYPLDEIHPHITASSYSAEELLRKYFRTVFANFGGIIFGLVL